MNKIIKENDLYVMICENGEEFQGKMHLEKGKTWLVRFNKNNPSGREFFTQSKIDLDIENNGEYVFDTKVEHRSGTSWKAKLTEAEKQEIAELEQRYNEIKEAAMSRQTPKVDKNSKEGIEAQIAALQKRLEAMRAE